MKDIDIFKKIKKYSKLSLIFTILIFLIFIISFAIIPAIWVLVFGQNESFDIKNDNSNYVSLAIILVSMLLILIFSILIFIYNILTIIKSCSLNDAKDKTLLVIMSILALFWLGIISNIVILVVSKTNIKKLSENQKTNTL